MGGSSNTWNERGCQQVIHAVAWAVCTFAALIYMHAKLHAAQFKHLPDVVMPSPGRHVGGGQPSPQHGQGLQEGRKGMQLTACWQRGSMGGVMMAGGDREKKTPCVLFFSDRCRSLAGFSTSWPLCHHPGQTLHS